MRPHMLIVCFAALLAVIAPAHGATELSDAELDGVAAGGVSVELADGLFRFQFSDNYGGAGQIDGSGTIAFTQEQLQFSALVLRDNAQKNLKSLVNINAVNSLIQVLVNLNINIHSTVGSVYQQNQSRSN